MLNQSQKVQLSKSHQTSVITEIEEEKIPSIPITLKRIKKSPENEISSESMTSLGSRIREKNEDEDDKVNDTLNAAMKIFLLQMDSMRQEFKKEMGRFEGRISQLENCVNCLANKVINQEKTLKKRTGTSTKRRGRGRGGSRRQSQREEEEVSTGIRKRKVAYRKK